MAFTKPTIFVEIDPNDYQSELNLNFLNIDSAFTTIQNELLKLNNKGAPLGPSNLDWVPNQTRLNGPVGFDSFVPLFTQTTDGWNLSLEHNAPSGSSSAIIDQLIHRTSTTQTWILENLVPSSGDGPFRMVIGLNSAGAPAIEQVVVHNEDGSDDPELVLYTFEYIRTTDGPKCVNMRRGSDWLMSQTAWNDSRDRSTVLKGQVVRLDTGKWTQDSDGRVHTDAIAMVPFDCRVSAVRFWFWRTPDASGGSCTVSVERNPFTYGSAADTSERIHQGVVTIGGTDSDPLEEVISMPANDPETILKAEDYIGLVITDPPSLFSSDDQQITVTWEAEVVPIQHDPRLNE